MILIDDSGWGSLLGSVMIGVYDTQTRAFFAGTIPMKYFQGKIYTKAKYRDQAWKIALKIIQTKLHLRGQDVRVCRGTCLDTIFDSLRARVESYQIKSIDRIEIKEPLQGLLEGKFASSLVKIGVPQKSSGAHCISFEEQLKWIAEDPKNRVKHTKTGWNSWQTKYSKNLK